ncbi:MAG TPA: hypothetical protein VH328_13270 [Burkholderiaceae bacterium]|jgi:hypothetical protein|nr:hypothetical protein [Burkholderiaceae bacterium]
MSQPIAPRLASLIAAVAVTASLLFGVTGLAHASAAVAASTIASGASISNQA